MNTVQVGDIRIGAGQSLALIAGPCVIENESLVIETAERLVEIAGRMAMPLIFKSSYAKANRSSVEYFTGPGIEKGLRILQRVRRMGVPVLSDVHALHEVEPASEGLDVLQLPAHLSMQTELTLALAKTGKPVNLKKGQFLSPEDMQAVVRKVESTGNRQILLTERGSCFGYRDLVADMRSLPVMRKTGYPVVFDATHVVRLYGLPSSDTRGGAPQFIAPLARAAVAAGCDAVFIETHPRVSEALCDAASMLPLDGLEPLLLQLMDIARVIRQHGVV
ncbi:MAG: 3-deoxy-8-phosphooctulonate synthase [candidate division Zixibacteria bacterium]|nr:3-deoxy-8-phosphooctulonate synthase [candidate division Zixibacteria bacterium]